MDFPGRNLQFDCNFVCTLHRNLSCYCRRFGAGSVMLDGDCLFAWTGA